MVALFCKTYAAIAHVPWLQATLSLQPMALRTVEEGERRGGNVLGLPKVAYAWLCLKLGLTWSNATDDAVVLDTGRAFLDALAALSAERGLLYRYLFLNDAAADSRWPATARAKCASWMRCRSTTISRACSRSCGLLPTGSS